MRDWKYICYVWLSEDAIVHPLMLLNVNTYANSVIEVHGSVNECIFAV